MNEKSKEKNKAKKEQWQQVRGLKERKTGKTIIAHAHQIREKRCTT